MAGLTYGWSHIGTRYHYLTIKRARWVVERGTVTAGTWVAGFGEKAIPGADKSSRYAAVGRVVSLANCSPAARKRR